MMASMILNRATLEIFCALWVLLLLRSNEMCEQVLVPLLLLVLHRPPLRLLQSLSWADAGGPARPIIFLYDGPRPGPNHQKFRLVGRGPA